MVWVRMLSRSISANTAAMESIALPIVVAESMPSLTQHSSTP